MRYLLLATLLFLLPAGCSSPGPPEEGGPQAGATLGTGVVDLIRLAPVAAGTAGEAQAVFDEARLRAEQVVREYHFDGGWPTQGWAAMKECGRFLARDGILRIKATGSDFQMAVQPDFDCSRAQRVLVRARVDHGDRGHLFWTTEDEPAYSGERSIQFWLHPGEEFHTYSIEVGEHEKWGGGITNLRLDPIDKPGTVEIDSVIFMGGLNRLETDLLAARCGLPEAALELRDDRRRVLAVAPGNPVLFDLEIPRAGGGSAPELCFAIGLTAVGPDGRRAVPGIPHRFMINTGDGETIFNRVLNPANNRPHGGWREERVSLDRFAGGPLELTFSVEPLGDPEGQDCLAVFANPLLQPNRRPTRPNVLVVLVDALRADRLGCYGHHRRATPHVDRFRRESVLFRHALASSSWTAPAVASLFTGLHPYKHGVRYVDTLDLDRRFETVAERFLEAGWFTGAVSDNLLITPGNGFDQGFRTFVSKPPSMESRKARAVTDIALRWFEHHGDRPFFLYLHYMDPHANYQPRQPFHPGPASPGATIRPFVERGQAGGVANRMEQDRQFRLTPAEDQRLLDLYEGEILATDFEVGRLLAGLEQSGLAGETVVVFVADHGEEFADHGAYAHATSLFDELVRVPLLVRLPGRGRIPSRVEAVVCGADLGPTLFRLAGVPDFTGEVDARVFSDLFEDGHPGGDQREAYFELNPYSRNPLASGTIEATRGLRYGDLKLLYEVRTGRYRLYDLAADPGERTTIYDDGDRRSMEMAARLSSYLEEAAAAADAGDADGGLLEDRQLRQLDALGYLDR